MTLTTIEKPTTRARDATAATMKAFVYRGPGKKALEDRPKPEITAPTDAIVKIVKTTICGTDLHILKGDVPTCQPGRILGHEGVGIVDKVGSAVTAFKPGDRVLISCVSACGKCFYCRKQMYSHCTTGGWILGNNCTLRHDTSVLHQYYITRHQMRTCDPSKLVVGEVPGLDAEDQADRAALHMAFAETRMELYRCKEALGILGVISQNVRAELHLAAGFINPLAHFERHRVRELVSLRVQNLRRFAYDGRTLGVSLLPPSLKTSCGGSDLGLELFVRQLFELLQELPGGRVEALVGHGLVLFQCCR